MLSIRFTDIILQFISIENNNLEQLATNIGIDEQLLNSLFSSYSESNIKFTNEELQTLKNKYINIISSNIPKDNFQKQSKAMITINNNTITTNAYILELSGEQHKQLKLNILENLKQEEIILQKLISLDEKYGEIINSSIEENYVGQIDTLIEELQNNDNIKNIKFTIYEQNGKTVRIKIEQESSEMLIDTVSSNEILGIDIKMTTIENEAEEILRLSIQKSRTEKYNLSLDISYSSEDTENNASFELNATNKENNIELNAYATIQDIEINLNSNINIVEEINYNVELDNTNNVVLNNLDAQTCNAIIELVGNRITERYQEEIMSILIYNMADNAIEESNSNLEQASINSFNAKFEQYQGNNVSGASVKALINMVITNNLASENKVSINGDIILEETDTDASQVSVDTYNTNNVECKYDNESELIKNITIYEN